jgi:thiamine biosynthesis lipoprotein ApbE
MRCGKSAVIAGLVLLAVSVAASAQSSISEVLVYGKKYVMGTIFEIAAYDRSSQHGSDAIAASLQEIVRIDALLSNYKPESALSQLNRSAHFHSQRVPPDLYRAVEESVRYSRLTQGKFDISVAPGVDLWKAALAGDAMPSAEQQEHARSCIGYEKIELAPPDQITFHSDCMTLDLGAIGKGYAVDRAAEVLLAWGIHNALINAGGSTIVAMGSPPGQTGWRMHLRDPSQKADPQVVLKDQSVSTSEQTPPSLLGKNSAGHIIDPVTGAPLRTDFAVSVVAQTGTASDALSTSLLLLGPEKGRVLVNTLENVSAIWISPHEKTEIVSGGPEIEFRGERPAAQAGNTR